MTWGEPIGLTPGDARYPARLRERLGANAPGQLSALGNLELLAQPKTALFCSALPSGSFAAIHFRVVRVFRGFNCGI